MKSFCVYRDRGTSSRRRFFAWLPLLALCGIAAIAQAPSPAAPTQVTAYYIDPSILNLRPLLAAPPVATSATTRDELALLHHIESARTPAQAAAAQADDAEEDIFIFRTLLGPAFRADQLPLTTAFSDHVHNEEAVVSLALKQSFARPRPYQTDPTLHPVCKLTSSPNSYPSGHTLSGYLLAFTLAEMLPERQQPILDRADDYAHNRLVCGVHYPTDLEASRRVAYAVFGYMMATPRFLHDLKAARLELRTHLGMAAAPN